VRKGGEVRREEQRRGLERRGEVRRGAHTTCQRLDARTVSLRAPRYDLATTKRLDPAFCRMYCGAREDGAVGCRM
jgi:hypothetical protein